MKGLLRRLREKSWLPPVSRKKAYKIARKKLPRGVDPREVLDRTEAKLTLYGVPDEPCWAVYAPWNDGSDGMELRSSHVIMVSKLSGRIVYDGSAGDEA